MSTSDRLRMEETMSTSDLRRLALCDDTLPQDRHDLIKARVMTSVRAQERAPREKTAGIRFRRRLMLTLIPAAVLLVGVGTAAAVSLMPRQAQENQIEMGFRVGTSVDGLVASARTADGRTFQFWITSPAPDAVPNGFVLVELDAHGTEVGGMGVGGSPGTWDFSEMGELWVEPPVEVSSAGGMLIQIMGHVPAPATTAEITLRDGTILHADVQTDGYFLDLVQGPGADVSPGNPETHSVEAIHVKAIDKEGDVIEEKDIVLDSYWKDTLPSS